MVDVVVVVDGDVAVGLVMLVVDANDIIQQT